MAHCLRRPVTGPAIIAIFLMAAPVLAQQDAEPVEHTPPGKWVFGTTFGSGAADGEYGDFLEKPINFDLNLAYEPGDGSWRWGPGIQFGSTDMKPPYDDQLEWARFDVYLFATRRFNRTGRVRPYL